MRQCLNDDTDAYSDADCDIRACARIRIEDQQAQEFIGELSREFLEFARSLSSDAKEYSEGFDEHKEHSDASEIPEPELGLGLTGANSLELKQSLVKRLLRFFGECYEKLVYCDISESGHKAFASRDRRKKRLLLEALITMFRKLLSSKESLNLRQLLEEQIKELREALEREEDPEVRKILQERLSLLMKLQVQLKNAKSFQSLDQFFLMLVAHSLSHATLTLNAYHSVVGIEPRMSYSASMGHLMDVENIALRGNMQEVGSMQIAASCVYGYQSSMDRCVADLFNIGTLASKWDERMVLSESILLTHAQRMAGDFGYRVAGRIMSILDQAVSAVATGVLMVMQEVVKNTMQVIRGVDAAVGQTGGRARGVAQDRARIQETVAGRDTQSCHIPGQGVPSSTFHRQAHIQFEHSRMREERCERSVIFESAEGIRCSAREFGYSSVFVSTQYSGIQCERETYSRNTGRGAVPSSTLESITVVAAEQQIVVAAQQVR
ncbi:hypothetical protein [Candidatus Anaplasma sp. TIGMIC]|uniref:hypothetical protein n=1 Tax=Candidatus Anaplasma sp. TIGMIC TaxID=3020713 RepID=UPI0023309767|nr:hypothetical protein [Candidatus Anaplasma sp. TIGMIC]MDB1135001.1 hypothetical protein [Candidatus Anaplasma sp. TIGMIC]